MYFIDLSMEALYIFDTLVMYQTFIGCTFNELLDTMVFFLKLMSPVLPYIIPLQGWGKKYCIYMCVCVYEVFFLKRVNMKSGVFLESTRSNNIPC